MAALAVSVKDDTLVADGMNQACDVGGNNQFGLAGHKSVGFAVAQPGALPQPTSSS